MNDREIKIQEESEAYNEYRKYIDTVVTARVELKARNTARSNGKDPNDLYVDAWGPVWEDYVKQALVEIESEKVTGEDSQKIENECRQALDKEIIDWLRERSPDNYTICFRDAAERIAALSRENEYLKLELQMYMDAYKELKPK